MNFDCGSAHEFNAANPSVNSRIPLYHCDLCMDWRVLTYANIALAEAPISRKRRKRVEVLMKPDYRLIALVGLASLRWPRLAESYDCPEADTMLRIWLDASGIFADGDDETVRMTFAGVIGIVVRGIRVTTGPEGLN